MSLLCPELQSLRIRATNTDPIAPRRIGYKLEMNKAATVLFTNRAMIPIGDNENRRVSRRYCEAQRDVPRTFRAVIDLLVEYVRRRDTGGDKQSP